MNAEATRAAGRNAWISGADGIFGQDVIARLRADGIAVVENVTDLPGDAALDLLVIDMTTEPAEIAFRDATENDFRALLDGQLYRLVAAVQAAVPRMTAGGAIVQIVPKAYLGSWGGVHVSASAAACVAMARSMALEFAALGIRVNTVAAGRSGERWDSPAARAELAATVAWLGGPDSALVTGEAVLADRGASLIMAQSTRR